MSESNEAGGTHETSERSEMTDSVETTGRSETRGGGSLFDGIKVGDLRLPHRIVMAPMTRNRAGDGNAPRELNERYYRQRASAALIVTEASQVEPGGVGYPDTPGIHSGAQVEGWTRVVDGVHEEGGRIFLQLWHVGRVSHPTYHDGDAPIAPSAIRPEGELFTPDGMKPFEEPRALETDEVAEVVDRFRHGAERAREAGFDGVEIHGANGYLIDQFLRSGSNRRTDRYGGSVENRLRFLTEVTEAVVGVWGADRVGMRLSPLSAFNDMEDADPEATFTAAAERLSKLGIAYLHLVEQNDFEDDPRDFDLGRLREAFDGPYMVNGGYGYERAEEVVATGRADLVSFGRAFLANPDLPRRFRERAPLNEPDPDTFYGGGAEGYVDYPPLDDGWRPSDNGSRGREVGTSADPEAS